MTAAPRDSADRPSTRPAPLSPNPASSPRPKVAPGRRAPDARQAWPDPASTPSRPPLLHRPLASYYLVLGSALLLVALGLVMVLSASSVQSYSSSGSSFTIFQKQAMWAALGLPALWLGSRLPVSVYRWVGYPLLVVSLVLLVAVLVPGVGHSVNYATRWIDFGPIQIQPSEPAKLALALWGADLLSRKSRLLDRWRHLLVPLVPVTMVFAALVMKEPDLGTTLVLLMVALALLWVVGAPARLFVVVIGGAVSAACALIAMAPYRMARITGFLNPFADAHNTGYQAVQGLYALASGGWFGVGLGASRQKWDYLPNQYTDYIFAIIGEELGLIGTLVVLLLFGMLGYAGIRIARRTRDPFARLAAAGVTAWLLGQATVNIGAVVGLLPITGIPLPMVSFGGSALLPTLFAVGMLMSFARSEPGAAAALAARRPLRRERPSVRQAHGCAGVHDDRPTSSTDAGRPRAHRVPRAASPGRPRPSRRLPGGGSPVGRRRR